MPRELKLYNVATTHKLPYEERDVARAHIMEEAWMEQMSEEVPEGEPTHYAVWLDDSGAEAFSGASNLEYLEEAAEDHVSGAIRDGVDIDQLTLNKTLDLEKGSVSPLMMVADTGATEHPYVKSRELERWTWFKDSGTDRHSHGSWCLGSATPPEPGRFVVSAKVLGDNGSGANSNGIAALYRFARLCRDRGVPGVASLSLGSNTPSQAYRDAVEYCLSQNVAVFAAAGNDGRRNGVSYPGAYAISIGAHDRDFGAASFSNRNASHSLPDGYSFGVQVNGLGLGGRTSVKSGSSMSVPAHARAGWYSMSHGFEAKRMKNLVRRHNGKGRILDGTKMVAAANKTPSKTPKKPTKPKPTPPSPAGLFSHASLREEER